MFYPVSLGARPAFLCQQAFLISQNYALFAPFLHQNLLKRAKNMEKDISTSTWSAQHPNAGQNNILWRVNFLWYKPGFLPFLFLKPGIQNTL